MQSYKITHFYTEICLTTWLGGNKFGWRDQHFFCRGSKNLGIKTLTSQCVAEHTLFRKETRWPGYYYRGDYMKLDDENWHCLTVSRRDPKTGKFTMEKQPVYHIIDEKEKKQAS